MAGSATTITTFHFTDLEPGLDVGLSIDFHYGNGGSHEWKTGTGDNPVDENGEFVYALSTRAFTHGSAGTAKVWARDGHGPFNAPPLKYVSGPDAGQDAVVTLHFP